jgi:hypothetical protein
MLPTILLHAREGGEPLDLEENTSHGRRHQREYASRLWVHHIESAVRNTNYRLRAELALCHLLLAPPLYAMNQRLADVV